VASPGGHAGTLPVTEPDLEAPPTPTPSPTSGLLRRLRRRVDRIFVATVLLPTASALLYFGLIASDVYISESRFVVRSPQRQSQTGLSALLQGTGFARAQDDTYSVTDYALSRDALRELDRRLNVRAAYSSPEIDRLQRFPQLDGDASFEALHRHYQKHVAVQYDSVSSITVLTVRAFTAKDARDVNELLLVMGEQLVNNMNDRSRQDLIQVASNEVALAEDKVRQAALALSTFRTDRSVFNPTQQSVLQLQAVGKIQEELLQAEAQLAEMRRLSPSNPQVASMTARVETLRQSVQRESAKVTGSGAGSLAAKAPAFERLTLEKEFADRQLASALGSLELARNEAQRKQLYLERLVQPNLPDVAVEPRRIRSILVVLVIGLISWGVVSLIVAGIREHTD
jgi:capsular polysaccharide transport system permease protein